MSERRAFHALICATTLVFLCQSGSAVSAQESPAPTSPAQDAVAECQVLYSTLEGVYVNVGSEIGLAKGETGRIERNGKPLSAVEVINVAKGSAFLRVLSPGTALKAGDTIGLVFRQIVFEEPLFEPKIPSPTLRVQNQEEDLIPLLAPPDLGELAQTDLINVFHGQLTIREMFQVSDDADFEYGLTRVGSSGSWERIGGTPWALEWSGDVSYRTGDGLDTSRDFHELRFEAYRFSLYRRFDDESFVRVGRFIPRELPSAGYLDGVQGEKVLSESVRLGSLLGFRPTREDLNLRFDEPTLVPYLTFTVGDRDDKLYYSGTAGVLLSLYEGDPDRMAILIDQYAQIGKLTISSSSEVDFDIGGTDVRSGTQFTRWDLFTSYPFSRYLTVRTGVDRYQRPDTAAERDAIDFGILNENEFFDRGYWRYWAGASHQLFWGLRLSEEINVTDSQVDEYTIRWNASLTKTGLPGMKSASMTVTFFNLEGNVQEGYGGRVSAHIPLMDQRLSISPAAAFRYVEDEVFDDEFDFTDISLRAHWIVSQAWMLSAGASYAFSDEVDRIFADVSVTYKW